MCEVKLRNLFYRMLRFLYNVCIRKRYDSFICYTRYEITCPLSYLLMYYLLFSNRRTNYIIVYQCKLHHGFVFIRLYSF